MKELNFLLYVFYVSHLKIRALRTADSLLKSCLSIKRRKERYGGRLASASSDVGKREEIGDYPLETYNRLRGEPSNSVFNPLARRRNVHHTS